MEQRGEIIRYLPCQVTFFPAQAFERIGNVEPIDHLSTAYGIDGAERIAVVVLNHFERARSSKPLEWLG
jgi:hypothetical protein